MTQRHVEGKLLRGLQVKSLDKEQPVTELVCPVNRLGRNPFPPFPFSPQLASTDFTEHARCAGHCEEQGQTRALASWSLFLGNWKEALSQTIQGHCGQS